MGVYINGMEKPKTGRYFVAVDNTDGKDKIVISVMSEFERGDKTRPLLAVHEAAPVPPHGDLIDYDFCVANYELLHDDDGNPIYAVRMRDINNAPTVIPAEEVYGKYTDTAGNMHWTGTRSGEHIIPAVEGK